MEMESLHNPNQAETAGPGPSSQRASYRNAQVWKDIEAETGFASYEDYLRFYWGVRIDFRSKLRTLMSERVRLRQFSEMTEDVPTDERIGTVIYDISMEERYPPQPSLRCYCESGTELMQALRKPPDGVCVQLVLWLRTDSPLSHEMVDTLGLGLRLDPDDFAYRKHWSPPPRKLDPQIKSIFGEQTVAAISRGFMRDVANEVPVVLVATASVGRYRNLQELSFVADHCEYPPYCRLPRELGRFNENLSVYGDRLGDLSMRYTRAVQNFIVQGRDVRPTKESLLLAAMSPLLYAAACRITQSVNEVQALYTNIVFGNHNQWRMEDLDTNRLDLRRIIEADENLPCRFSRYLGSKVQLDLSKHPSYVAIVAELRSLIADARRLDAEVRDFKQIQVGDLALKESQKSIELSTAQIREAKSVKIFTVLAFIYVPLNLATSIFGMNIEQLNGNGQQIWVFFTTAVAALLVTGGSWLCTNRLTTHKAVIWYRERAAAKKALHEERESREYGLLFRLAMLVWLVRNGHTLWMLKSGAGAAVLTNNIAVMASGRFYSLYGETPISACDYVSKFSSPSENKWKKRAFRTDPSLMVTWSTPLSHYLPRWIPRPRNAERTSAEGSA